MLCLQQESCTSETELPSPPAQGGPAYSSLAATRRDHGGSWGRKTQAGLEKQLGAEARRG